MKRTTKYRVLSLFANIGVAEAFLKEMGIEVTVANELIPKRASLYQGIYPDTKMICGDITQKSVIDSIVEASIHSNVNVVMATPPCQGMSTAGKLKTFDVRNELFYYALDIIVQLAPAYFLIENVPAFLTTKVLYHNVPTFIPDVIKDILADDYDMTFNVINAQDYGVPQSRERMILLGTRKDISKKWIMPEHDDHLVTMRDAIGDIPIIDPFVKDISKEELHELFPHFEERREEALRISKWNIPTAHVLRNVIAMMHTPTGQTAFDNSDRYKPRKKDGTIVSGFHNTYKRQNWDSPAYTIAMDNIEISSQNNVHPGRYAGKDANGDDIYSDPRALTLYELMCLMTIPADWPIPEETSPVFLRKMIGEGIPSLLVKKIFTQIL